MIIKIPIPKVERDTRIGSVFNSLFYVINATEHIPEGDIIEWDFSNSCFFHPFFIGILGLYRSRLGRPVAISGLHRGTEGYLDAICFNMPKILQYPDDAKCLFEEYSNRTYLPICDFSIRESVMDAVTSQLQRIVERQINCHSSLKSALSYLIGEMTGNIHDHSGQNNGYFFAQYLPKDKSLNICIADFGRTIYGSFVKSGKFGLNEIPDEGTALNLALGDKSTKNLPEVENRGYGLPTSKKMIVEGLGGEFFILSGSAFHRHDTKGEQTVTLPSELSWDGTIVLVRVPTNVPDSFQYLNYIERL